MTGVGARDPGAPRAMGPRRTTSAATILPSDRGPVLAEAITDPVTASRRLFHNL